MAKRQTAQGITKVEKSLLQLQTQIEKRGDSNAILWHASELLKSARELRAELVRDCLAEMLASGHASDADTQAILGKLRRLLD